MKGIETPKQYYKRVILSVVLSAFGAVVLDFLCIRMMRLLNMADFAWGSNHVFRTGLFFAGLLFCFFFYILGTRRFSAILYRYRFLFAAVLFVSCVLLEIHGSSLGAWNAIVQPSAPPNSSPEPIIGGVRFQRSDEFIVSTPLAFSQAFTGYAPVNPIAAAWPTNMLTLYNQPVLDPTLIAKPFYWGYLLFGTAKGLSWFWCGRLIALFLVTFECFMLLINKKKGWALLAAFLITFASAIQWWFAINFFVEMIVFGQLAIIAIWQFFQAGSKARKLVWAVVFALSICAYVFALYPPWQIPLVYLFAVLFIWVVVKAVRKSKSEGKVFGKSWIYVAVSAVIAVALVGCWYYVCRDTIGLMMNTSYPGSRISTGGGALYMLFNYWIDPALPFTNPTDANSQSMFLSLFPVGEAAAIVLLIRTRLKDKLLLALLLVNAFLFVYLVFGFPGWLARISLLSRSHTLAVAIVMSLISVFILVRAFASIRIQSPRGRSIRNGVAVALVIVTLAGGLLVNPLVRGVHVVTEKPLYFEVQWLQERDNGNWIATWPTGNFVIMAGAPTITSTNIIPALDRWKLLDPGGKYKDIYNKFAHIYLAFTSDATQFKPGTQDSFELHLSMNDLKKLGVKYICLNKDRGDSGELPEMTWDNGYAEQVYDEYGIVIYKVSYTD